MTIKINLKKKKGYNLEQIKLLIDNAVKESKKDEIVVIEIMTKPKDNGLKEQ